MAVILAVGLAAPTLALVATVGRRGGPVALALSLAGGMAATMAVVTAAALAGAFVPRLLAAGCVAVAAVVYLVARGRRRPVGRRDGGRAWIHPLLLLALAAALRAPPMLFPLGGRDQGTYLLRARHLARTGRIDGRDRLLAELFDRPVEGDEDVWGVYRPRLDGPLASRYAAAYRPGFYLADARSGRVVPQFLHGQPALLAAWSLAFGRGTEGWCAVYESVLAALLVGLWLRRVAPGWPGALLGLVYAADPLSVWTGRQTLSEPAAALFVAAAGLAANVLPDHRARGPVAAAFLGAWGWVRGDAWGLAALAGAVAAVSGGRDERCGVGLLGGLLAASVVVHAWTSYPYVHDEVRRWTGTAPSPAALAVAGALLFAALAGLSLLPAGWRRLPPAGWARPARVLLLALPLAVGTVLWWLDPGSGRAARLDPALAAYGPLGVGAALVAGLWGAGRLLRTRSGAPGPWELGLAAAAAWQFASFAPQNLPRAHLYYYGRYLVPLLLPAALGAVAAAAGRLWRGNPGRRRRWLAVPLAGPYLLPIGGSVLAPSTHMVEFAGAGDGVDAVARAIPEDAVVVAGGEGWHGGHTFNQVGGALAIDHGRTVLPYRTDEQAHAAAYHLLVRRPARLGTPPPRVFLLRNEATLPRRDATGREVVVVDDEVPATLSVVDRVDVDLVYDRLTPDGDRLPRRVTRDGIRMVLLEVAAADSDRGAPARASPVGEHSRCLGPADPLPLSAPPEAVQVMVEVAMPNSQAPPTGIGLRLPDGSFFPLVERRPRPGRTLGPAALAGGAGGALVHRGPAGGPCPGGRLLAVRYLPPPSGAPAPRARIVSLPPDDHGVAVTRATFVPGRALSPHRPVVRAGERAGLSFVVAARQPVDFGPVALPRAGRCPVVLSATLRRRDVDAGARLRVRVGTEMVELPIPAGGRGASPTPWRRVTPPGAVARVRVELATPRPETDRVHLRDVVFVPLCDAGAPSGGSLPGGRAGPPTGRGSGTLGWARAR